MSNRIKRAGLFFTNQSIKSRLLLLCLLPFLCLLGVSISSIVESRQGITATKLHLQSQLIQKPILEIRENVTEELRVLALVSIAEIKGQTTNLQQKIDNLAMKEAQTDMAIDAFKDLVQSSLLHRTLQERARKANSEIIQLHTALKQARRRIRADYTFVSTYLPAYYALMDMAANHYLFISKTINEPTLASYYLLNYAATDILNQTERARIIYGALYQARKLPSPITTISAYSTLKSTRDQLAFMKINARPAELALLTKAYSTVDWASIEAIEGESLKKPGDVTESLLTVNHVEDALLSLSRAHRQVIESLRSNATAYNDALLISAQVRFYLSCLLIGALTPLFYKSLTQLTAQLVKPLTKIKEQLICLSEGTALEEYSGSSMFPDMKEILKVIDGVQQRLLEKELKLEALEEEITIMSRPPEDPITLIGENSFAIDEVRHTQEQSENAQLALSIASFEESLSEALSGLHNCGDQLFVFSETLQETTETTMTLSQETTKSIEISSTNIRQVASATEEITSSIRDVGTQMQETNSIAIQSTKEVDMAEKHVSDLVSVSEKIGSVISLITDIAEQTNLLALNATIEAARAGEAGRGFAVVASEVKNLASQTAKATEDISNQILNVQHASDNTAKAVSLIKDGIIKTSKITSSVASVVDEQNVATEEISRSIKQVSSMASQASDTASFVSSENNKNLTIVEDLNASIQNIINASDHVNSIFDAFKKELTAVS
ncbi:methyl-accepting chemotaxis protein [Temperatibacter marinus]|uniref:Methyl-accepting chemotaxis protein n=1 Tax=Temperatibacter marinus TaxID=1456591 RepID=A0AA52H9K1_9PROT|nr:methyl-accepting chemotaxis protein [Temperatibacter marinus]WND01703.1 methyl-accepting chemotaxis protein [Temperatibacter marinus]